MDHLRRLIAVLFLCCSASAFAEPAVLYYAVVNFGGKSATGHSAAAACNAYAAKFSPPLSVSNITNTSCNIGGTNAAVLGTYRCRGVEANYSGSNPNSSTACPAPSPCPDGQYWGKNGLCEAKTCKAGIKGASSGDSAGTYCDPLGCVVGATTIVTPKGSRSVWMTTGGVCKSEPDAPPSAPQPPASGASAPAGTGPCPGGADVCPPDSKHSCPKGTFATDVGGTALCVSMKPIGNEPKPTDKTSGGTSSTGTTDKQTTTKTTTNPDGSTTTTTSETSSSTGTESKPNDIASYCNEHPEASACSDAGSWSGGCGAFTCGGDAVQCAQAQAAWKLACQLDIDPQSSVVQAGNAAMAGQVAPGQDGGSSVGLSSFDESNPFLSSCPADLHFSVAGRTLTIPFSTSCPWFQAVGYFFVVGALLVGLSIAFGGGNK